MSGKRLLDFSVALVALVVLWPVLLVIGLLVRLDSRGPALFRQQRIGLHGRVFAVYKFRTMAHAAGPQGALLTVGRDPRITRLGAFLRTSKLDELPQLWNVLRGDMSLVGPRPEVAQYVALYPPELRRRILSVRPGITDPASIEFRDEARLLGEAQDPERRYREEILPRKLELYSAYVQGHTLAGDLAILWRTFHAVLRL